MEQKIKSFFSKKENIMVALLFFIAAFLPLIIYTYIHERSEYSLEFKAFPLQKGDYDFFHYCKAIVLIIVSFCITGLLISKKTFHQYKEHIPLMLFAFFVFISSIFSEYRAFTFIGGAESYQGVFVWLSYIIICIAASQLKSLKNIKILLLGIVASGVFLSVIGFLEYFSSEFFEGYLTFFLEGERKLNYKDAPMINSLSYNTNYYGVFLYLPLVLIFTFYLTYENKKVTNWLLISYILIYFNMVGVRTLAGDITYLLVILSISFMLWKKGKLVLKKLVTIIVISIGVFLFVFNNVAASSIQKNPADRFQISTESSTFDDAVVKDSVLELNSFIHPKLFIKLKDGRDLNFSEYEDFKSTLPIKKVNNKVIIDKEIFEGYQFTFKKVKDLNLMVLNYHEKFNYNIVITDKTFKTINPHTNKIIDIITSEKIQFLNRNGGFFTGRGIVWALGIPQINFLGHGTDVFPLVFPNDDYLSKIKQYKLNKPPYIAAAHSLYLQIAIEFGLIGLLLFLATIFIYVFNTVKLLIKASFEYTLHFVSLACCFAVIGYCILGVTNSSMLTSSPNFWILLGIGLAANSFIKKEHQESKV